MYTNTFFKENFHTDVLTRFVVLVSLTCKLNTLNITSGGFSIP